jgi:putative cardiolipin synthase
MYWSSDLTQTPGPAGDDAGKAEKAAEFYVRNESDPAFLADLQARTSEFFAQRPSFTCRDLAFVTDFPNPGEKNRKVFPAIAKELAEAQNEVLAESPYFVIRKGGMELLDDLHARGVGVTVLTNTLRSTDAGYTVASMNWRLRSLAKTGLNLFGFTAGPVEGQSNRLYAEEPRWGLHSKRAVIDGKDTLVGTYNIDPRSANLNSEVLFICRGNPELAAHVAGSIRERMKHSVELIDKEGRTHVQRLISGASAGQIALYLAIFPIANLFDFLL